MTLRQAWQLLAKRVKGAIDREEYVFLCNEIKQSRQYSPHEETMMARIREEIARQGMRPGTAIWDTNPASMKKRLTFCRKVVKELGAKR